MSGSLCSLFPCFNWFWVPIKCNLRRVLGSPYVPPEAKVFGAGKQDASVCGCTQIAGGSGIKSFGRLGTWHHRETSLHILILTWEGNTRLQNILYLRLFGLGRFEWRFMTSYDWVKKMLCLTIMCLHSFFLVYFCVWRWISFDFLIPPAFNFPEFSLCLDLES